MVCQIGVGGRSKQLPNAHDEGTRTQHRNQNEHGLLERGQGNEMIMSAYYVYSFFSNVRPINVSDGMTDERQSTTVTTPNLLSIFCFYLLQHFYSKVEFFRLINLCLTMQHLIKVAD